ncbi:MAG: ABC transporter ATP-binding protein [Candidatus Omnitrophica bacterium]|nr:ABC transporter ATP-binding protein [Candidatus Omnitrophota bacterium]
MISIRGLRKEYGTVVAVDDLTLDIPQGSFFAFLGPNGAGKTTTIKLLVGLLRPTQGSVAICGYDIQRDYERAKELISYIPDFPFLYDKLTGREFLDFVVQLYPCAQNELRQNQVREELLSVLGLEGVQHRLIEQYSHGMRQKLVFTAAFLHEPRVLIIDEPMVGLDPHASHVVKRLLRERAQQGATVFLSTHQLSVAEELADTIGIIDRGKLLTVGTLEQLSASAGLQGKLEEIFLRLTREEIQ